MPWSFKARLMGIPDSSNGETFHEWAQLPISREQYRLEQMEEHRRLFPECQLLPGVSPLLHSLANAKNVNGEKIQIALASSTSSYHYELKTSRPEVSELFTVFSPPISYSETTPASNPETASLLRISSSSPSLLSTPAWLPKKSRSDRTSVWFLRIVFRGWKQGGGLE